LALGQQANTGSADYVYVIMDGRFQLTS